MEPSATDTLCTRCGLCCDGSLFADVELAGAGEATRLELLGLDVDDDGAEGTMLLQPCAALRGRRCGIYPHRPGCCRTFECRLLLDVRRGATSVGRARERVAEVHAAIARVKALLGRTRPHSARLPLLERCAEWLARATAGNPESKRRRAELRKAMSRVERLVRDSFLIASGERGGARRR